MDGYISDTMQDTNTDTVVCLTSIRNPYVLNMISCRKASVTTNTHSTFGNLSRTNLFSSILPNGQVSSFTVITDDTSLSYLVPPS